MLKRRFRSRRLLERWAVSSLVLVVGTFYLVLSRLTPFSPSIGGAFGMYASADDFKARSLLAEGLDAQGNPCRIRLSPEEAGLLELEEVRRLRICPTKARLELLAGRMMAKDFIQVPTGDGRPVLRLAEKGREGPTTRLRAVRVSLWGVTFDGPTASLGWRALGDPVALGSWP